MKINWFRKLFHKKPKKKTYPFDYPIGYVGLTDGPAEIEYRIIFSGESSPEYRTPPFTILDDEILKILNAHMKAEDLVD